MVRSLLSRAQALVDFPLRCVTGVLNVTTTHVTFYDEYPVTINIFVIGHFVL